MRAKALTLKGLIMSGMLLSAGPAMAQPAMSDEVKSELAALSGTWIRVMGDKPFIFHFNQNKFASVSAYPDTSFATVATVTIDPTKKPKRMDLTFSEGTGRAERLKGKTQLDIYQLDGDTLKFAAPRGSNRPEAFPDQEAVEGGEHFYLVFRRAK
jgi:uncharacterized protein (TIGR03067 family)